MFCNRCGTETPPGGAFCRKCGALVSTPSADREVSRRFCNKCGAEIQPGSAFCNKCGTLVSVGQTGAKVSPPLGVASSAAVKANFSGVLTIVGCLSVILGAFFPWVSKTHVSASVLGVNLTQGPATLMAGVLSLAVFILAPANAQWKRGIFLMILGALTLALVFQSMYCIKHHLGVGLWVSMIGGFVIIIAGVFQAGVFKRPAGKSAHAG